ncbi:MAG: hypothetical protein DMG96_22640 [Acidobacteria bacterium]|nr:MAG: hypothetical protein DMG98_25015 [Acidobacteriota bacterium]PYV73593.1 MAG: hypothetical protein DMG96_22640 [Acidobacteriota bacterium]
MSLLQNHENHNRQFTLVIFVTFVGQTERRQACRLSAQRWEDHVGRYCCGWEFERSDRRFGIEGLALK